LLKAIADRHNLHFVQLARAFFAVAGDERHCAAFFEENCGSGDLAGLEFEFARDFENVMFDHIGEEKCEIMREDGAESIAHLEQISSPEAVP